MLPSEASYWLTICSATTSVVFLAWMPCEIRRLYRASFKVHLSWHTTAKVVICTLYATLQLALLVTDHLARNSPRSPRDTVEASLSLAASLGLIWLSPLSHRRSIRPSNLAMAYLLARFICYLVWLPVVSSLLPPRLKVSIAAQACAALIVLISEGQDKRSSLFKSYTDEPPESTSSFMGNVLFLWINRVLAQGYSKPLPEDKIPVLDRSASSKGLRHAILRTWDQRPKPENRATLPRALLLCLFAPFLSAILPRIFLIAFRFAQPLLISRAIRFMTHSSVEDDDHTLRAYYIVVEAAATYIGMAISVSAYRHRLNRLEIMIRGALIGLLHEHALEARGAGDDDGRVVTLMSNDVGNLENSGEMVHETWARFSEVVIGTYLLSRQVGWLWPVPIVFIFVCSRVSRHVAKNLKPEQGKWNAATQHRISATSSMLGAMKNIKMLGIQQPMAYHIEDLRQREMDAAWGVRWLMFGYNVSANALGLFAPVLTIVLYAVLARLRGVALDVETAFTTIAVLAMITHPANMIMTILPRAVVSLSSFERIQAYLLDGGRPSGRRAQQQQQRQQQDPDVAIRFDNVTIANPFDPSRPPVLRDVTLDIPHGSVTILTGPVGAGKTTLARAVVLGGDDAAAITTHGIVRVAPSRIAYCAQKPWLPNQTIRDIIRGPADSDSDSDTCFDQARYEEALHACCLGPDLATLPAGDRTPVGTQGMNLSGGQRQRVALARAVYHARHASVSVVLLDDALSALDAATQARVAENLLGGGSNDGACGLLRRSRGPGRPGPAVIWISTATQHFRLADEVIVLADGAVRERGTWERLRRDDPLIDEVIHARDQDSSPPAEQALLDAAPSKKGAESASRGPTETKSLAAEPAPTSGDLSLYTYYARASRPLNIAVMVTCTCLYGLFNNFPAYWLRLWTETPRASTLLFAAGYVALVLGAWASTCGGMYTTELRVAPASGLALHRRLLAAVAGAPLVFLSAVDAGSLLSRFSADLHLVDRQLAPAALSLATQAGKLTVQAALLLLASRSPAVALSLPPSILVVWAVQRVYLRTSRRLRVLELDARGAAVSGLLEAVAGAPTARAFGWGPALASRGAEALDASQKPLYLLLCLQRWLGVVLDLLVAAIAVGTIAIACRGGTTGGQIGVALNVILVANTTLLRLVQSWTGLEISLGAVARVRQVEEDTPREEGEEEEEGRMPPPEDWPSRGAIQLSSVTAAYDPASTAIALRNIDLTISAGQTVVLCGRTGSGKSSLLLALLRLLDVTTAGGRITIDDVDVARRLISRSALRARAFVTVAQEAFFLPLASLRFNLDPEESAPTSAIVSALRRTGLWDHFCVGGGTTTTKTTTACSDEEIGESRLGAGEGNGSAEGDAAEVILATPLNLLPALSTGQSQLLALARALVRRHVLCNPAAYVDSKPAKPIILLDEVTSSLDPETEGRIYNIIQDEFMERGHTVVMVTHKLAAFRSRLRVGKDAVVWMAEGRIEKIEVVSGEEEL